MADRIVEIIEHLNGVQITLALCLFMLVFALVTLVVNGRDVPSPLTDLILLFIGLLVPTSGIRGANGRIS